MGLDEASCPNRWLYVRLGYIIRAKLKLSAVCVAVPEVVNAQVLIWCFLLRSTVSNR